MNAVVSNFFRLPIGLLFLVLLGLAAPAEANFINFKDTITDSGPSAKSNHTLQFKTTKDIAPGETIRFGFDPGIFTWPNIQFSTSTGSTSPPTPNTWSNNNVELLVDSGSGYVRRNTGTTTSTSVDGVTLTTGNSGYVAIQLNTTTGISANSVIRLLVGNHTSLSTTTDTAITNATTSGSMPFYLSKTGADSTQVRGWIAMVDRVGVGPVDTTEEIPPYRFNGAPTGTLSGTTLNVEVSLETDEFATCRYSQTASTSYLAMPNTFTVTGSVFHSFIFPVTPDTDYNIYVRCADDEDNQNPDDYVISFILPQAPSGNAGNAGDEPGSGDGTGTGSGNTGSGDGDGGGDGGGSSSQSGGGGGGGGGGSGDDQGGEGGGGFEPSDNAYPSGDGRVIINGYAFPDSTVVALVDGTVTQNVRADSSGKFVMTLDEIARGVYNFGVYAIDQDDVKSSTFTTTFTVTGARTTSLSNINVMPSVAVSPDPVDPGETLTVSGYTIPDAEVTIQNQNDKSSVSLKTFTTTSNGDGFWSIEVATNGFSAGTYKVRAKAKTDSIETNYSDYTYYGVGQAASLPASPDLNRDGKVNLIDFSILLYWWGTDGGNSNPPADINQDGNVSLTDFSILLFNWTG